MKIFKISVIAVSLLMIISVFSGCISREPEESGIKGIVKYGTYDEIQRLLDKAIEENQQYQGSWLWSRDMAETADGQMAPQDSSGTRGSSDYSETNIQVEGVDEADIIKTDGSHIYLIANNMVVIADASDPAEISVVSDIAYNDGKTPFEIYLDSENEKLTVISRTYESSILPYARDASEEAMPDVIYPWWGQESISVSIYNISDKTNPVFEREFIQEGLYISSRRINEHIYIITAKHIFDTGNDDPGILIPATSDTQNSDDWKKIPPESVYVVEDSVHNSFIVMGAIDTSDSEQETEVIAVLGSGHNVYASADNIYVANTRYDYNGEENDISVTVTERVENDMSEPSEAFRIIDPPFYTTHTDILRFEIDRGEINIKSAGEVPGYIINQFSMDEYGGYFRIATTTGDTFRTDEFTSVNNLYILDSELNIAGKVEGLAATETIRSVRFAGEMAYMVTFRTTDPLFVFNLSDPNNPLVEGELKIEGFSQYLHPVTDTILLGIGRDAEEEGDIAIEKGIKISVFDVSDVNDPKEISTHIIGGAGTYSEVLHNHRALLYSREKNIIAFPVTVYEENREISRGRYHYFPSFSGYIILGMDGNYKVYERGRISHFEMPSDIDFDDDREMWRAYDMAYMTEYLYRVKRGIYIDDNLFTFSDAKIMVNSLEDFSETGKTQLPGFKGLEDIYRPDEPGVSPGSKPGQTDGDFTPPYDYTENMIFTGKITEVHENGILVTTQDAHGFDIATVWFAPDIKIDFDPEKNQKVEVEILPEVRESYPVQVTAVRIKINE